MRRFSGYQYLLPSMLICTLIWTSIAMAEPVGISGAPKAVEKAEEETVSLQPQSTCPISGKAIEPTLFADLHGYRIYAASNKGLSKIKADPQKAIKTLLLRGETPEALPVAKPQTSCPIMDDPINKNRFADVNGYRIYVCCRPCITDVQANPDKSIYKILKGGEIPEPHPVLKIQSHCPLDGNSASKEFVAKTQDGRPILACSAVCAQKIKDDPAKALERMLAYGESAPLPSSDLRVSQKSGFSD